MYFLTYFQNFLTSSFRFARKPDIEAIWEFISRPDAPVPDANNSKGENKAKMEEDNKQPKTTNSAREEEALPEPNGDPINSTDNSTILFSFSFIHTFHII